MIAAIAAHHDLEQLRLLQAQAVILGTRWAEVEFRDDPSPDALGQLNFIMGKTLGLPSAAWNTSEPVAPIASAPC